MSEIDNKLFLGNTLLRASRRFEGDCVGEVCYGWHNKSAGKIIIQKNSEQKWLQTSFFSSLKLAKLYLNRIKQANSLKGICKPYLYKSIFWEEDNQYCVALLMTYIREKHLAQNLYLTQEIDLPFNWLSNLKKQLDYLALQSTNFTSCRQDLITRRIQERYGTFDCEVRMWGTIHGDLNWLNITSQTPYLLDWEGWGTGPLGLDVSFLYCFSLLSPKTANAIKTFFEDFFQSKHGKLCLLFVCCELLRMIEIYGDHPELQAPLSYLSEGIIKNEHTNL